MHFNSRDFIPENKTKLKIYNNASYMQIYEFQANCPKPRTRLLP